MQINTGWAKYTKKIAKCTIEEETEDTDESSRFSGIKAGAEDNQSKTSNEEEFEYLAEDSSIRKEIDQRDAKRKRKLKMKRMSIPCNCSHGKKSNHNCKHKFKSGDVVGAAVVVPRDGEESDSEELIHCRNLNLIDHSSDTEPNSNSLKGINRSDEIDLTVEVGKAVGFELEGKLDLVRQLLEENGEHDHYA